MLERLGSRKLMGLLIIILCLFLVLGEANLYSLSSPNSFLKGATPTILAAGGIILGSYLVLGPLGAVVSFVLLTGRGCGGGGGGQDLGEPPEPPGD